MRAADFCNKEKFFIRIVYLLQNHVVFACETSKTMWMIFSFKKNNKAKLASFCGGTGIRTEGFAVLGRCSTA
jgi:hypothetical protein